MNIVKTVKFSLDDIRASLDAQSNEIYLEMTIATHNIGIEMQSVFTYIYYDVFLNKYVLFVRTLTVDRHTLEETWHSKKYVINKKSIVVILDLYFLQYQTVRLLRLICNVKGHPVIKRWLKNMNSSGFLLK